MKNTKTILQILLIVVAIVGTVYGISHRFVSKDVFIEFKEGAIESIYGRLERMDNKLDKIAEKLQG